MTLTRPSSCGMISWGLSLCFNLMWTFQPLSLLTFSRISYTWNFQSSTLICHVASRSSNFIAKTSRALLLSQIPSAKAATRLHNLSYQYIPFERQFYGNTSNDDHKGSIHWQQNLYMLLETFITSFLTTIDFTYFLDRPFSTCTPDLQ